jgi:hypothetical protein
MLPIDFDIFVAYSRAWSGVDLGEPVTQFNTDLLNFLKS